jgi:hypothetical protein
MAQIISSEPLRNWHGPRRSSASRHADQGHVALRLHGIGVNLTGALDWC